MFGGDSCHKCHCAVFVERVNPKGYVTEIQIGVGGIETISPQSCHVLPVWVDQRGPLILARFSIQKSNFEVPILTHTFIALRLLSRPPPPRVLHSTTPAAHSHNTQTTFAERNQIQRQIRCNQITSTRSQAMKVLLQIYSIQCVCIYYISFCVLL